MKSIPVGPAGLTAPNVVLGLMRIADKSDDEIRALVSTARDAGINFFDHADVYGTRMHECEELRDSRTVGLLKMRAPLRERLADRPG